MALACKRIMVTGGKIVMPLTRKHSLTARSPGRRADAAGWNQRGGLSRLMLLTMMIVLLLPAACVHKPRTKTGQADAQPTEQVISVDGMKRTYLLYVPPSYAKSRPASLLFAFHGGGGTSQSMVDLSQFDTLADQYGFIVVYPQGIERAWHGFGYPQFVDDKPVDGKVVDDVAFVRAMIERIKSEYAIDSRRIYAAGLSLGGMFSYHLACRMSDTFAAIAVASSSMITANCKPQSPVAVLHIHPRNDEVVPLAGGQSTIVGLKSTWPPVENGINFWRERNGCAKNRNEVFNRGGSTCWAYAGCSGDKNVEFCLVEGGHQWPGVPNRALWQMMTGAQVDHDFPASERIMEFFQAHPK